MPRQKLPQGEVLSGDWLWTSRAGAEVDVESELRRRLGAQNASVLGSALVRSKGAPTFPSGELDVTFARQGFRVVDRSTPSDIARIAAGILTDVGARPFALSGWVPDTDSGNPLAGNIAELTERVRAQLEASGHSPLAVELLDGSGVLAQLAMIDREQVIFGGVEAHRALTLAPGGRARMRVAGDRPSRAARKVEEALAWLGVSPSAGEVCVDLGAAPGGWSWALLARRAKVIAVDPAELRPDIAAHRGLRHRKESAFQFAPEEPVDWLFCDMAWKPLEVAQLLAKWGRKRWARLLVANLKLPMKKKAETVADLREVLAGGGWQRIRTRQLYHDRDEITVLAHA